MATDLPPNQMSVPRPSNYSTGHQGLHKSIMYIESEAISMTEMLLFKSDCRFPAKEKIKEYSSHPAHLSLGIQLFHQDICQGLSYLLLFDCLSPTLPDLSQFLSSHISNKASLFNVYTSLRLKESP